jgi:hypothetical protein
MYNFTMQSRCVSFSVVEDATVRTKNGCCRLLPHGTMLVPSDDRTNPDAYFFPWRTVLLAIGASRSHLDTPQSVGVLWTSDHTYTETSI